MENLKNYQRFWVWVAEYYAYPITENQVKMWAEDIQEYNLMDLKRAFMAYRKDKNNNFIPRPNQIIQLLEPEISPRALADEAAGRIYQAITLCGYDNSNGAKEFIGELGWRVVEREGGWVSICRTCSEQNKGTTKAQWRDMALSIIERSKYGLADIPPALPSPGLKKLSESMQGLIPRELRVVYGEQDMESI